VGATISLIPLGGDVHLSSHGLQWNLHDETLHAFASRGVSNIAVTNEVNLELGHGIIAVVQPHYLTQGAPQ
jgi:thiamine pyrophosphokinase